MSDDLTLRSELGRLRAACATLQQQLVTERELFHQADDAKIRMRAERDELRAACATLAQEIRETLTRDLFTREIENNSRWAARLHALSQPPPMSNSPIHNDDEEKVISRRDSRGDAVGNPPQPPFGDESPDSAEKEAGTHAKN